MKTVVTALIAVAGLVLAGGAQADPKAGEALSKSHGCIACHQMDKKVVGPGFKEIAAKYRDKKGAEAELIKKVKMGGKGVWGDMIMPPNAHVKDDDIKSMVQWILTLK
jgi:cytochrome c